MSKEIVLVGACRTAMGKMGGTLADIPAEKLGAIVMKEAIERAGIKPSDIDEVLFGNPDHQMGHFLGGHGNVIFQPLQHQLETAAVEEHGYQMDTVAAQRAGVLGIHAVNLKIAV